MAPLAIAVDQNELVLSRVCSAVRAAGYVTSRHTAFHAARQALKTAAPDLVVTAIRLRAFNGIHLAYLARAANPHVLVMVYGEPHDALLAGEAQRAGAFYEPRISLLPMLRSFLSASLPDRDRRSPQRIERRLEFRGGRRAADRAVAIALT